METKNRIIRPIEVRAKEDEEYIIEGYASTFEPYVMRQNGDTNYYEVIDRNAFDETDMGDVVLRIDHEGKVYARNSTGTMEVSVDDGGLHFVADLSKTESQRSLYEDVKAGLYPQASFAFSIRADEFDKKEHTRTITQIGKLYDVAVVSFPANPTTSVSARDAMDESSKAYYDGVIMEEQAERLAEEKRQRAKEELELLLSIGEE